MASRAPADLSAGAGRAAKRPCCSHLEIDSAGEVRWRSKPHLIDTLVTQRAFLYGFQTGLKQLQAVFPSRHRFLFPDHVPRTTLNLFALQSSVVLVTQGRFCTKLAQRLLCLPGQRALLHALRHATSVLSRRHISDLCGDSGWGTGSDFSLSRFIPPPLLATGSEDNTAKLWR